MSYVLTCPHCGIREVTDFAFGGEVSRRPRERPTLRELGAYNYFRRNVAGVQREWWYHRSGCRAWFLAERDTRTNAVLWTALPEEAPDHDRPEAGRPSQDAGLDAPRR
ncbi:MAG TPA: sarcosine oxidase subunit delta [Solirubrobacteraceae bacterium]